MKFLEEFRHDSGMRTSSTLVTLGAIAMIGGDLVYDIGISFGNDVIIGGGSVYALGILGMAGRAINEFFSKNHHDV